MKKRNQKQDKRVKKLILSTGLFAVLLVASTYAWFIGMQNVNVTAFDVKIAAIDGISISLKGTQTSFSDTVTINKDNFDDQYTDHQNVWGDLIPMSSVGVINNDTSKLVLYEKGSLTTTHGGYRILASKVQNDADKEAEGYVAFDLFIKNLSGEEYYADYNELNEEAIYLTTNSEVTAASNGIANTKTDESGHAGTGIENSVRVAFAQIARVEATEQSDAKIQGLSCQGGDGVTVICDQRLAQIWEPNDTKHEKNAIKWYNTACLARDGKDVTKEASYGGKCATVSDDEAYPTYAIATVIDDKNNTNVDVYDGSAYNGYTKTIEEGYLQSYTYFTDTDKLKRGMDRPEFITLAPNSITKVRVYIWIEGQDIDNYDFAQLGNAISVKFGFTKERFTDVDVAYDKNATTATLPNGVIGDYTKGE